MPNIVLIVILILLLIFQFVCVFVVFVTCCLGLYLSFQLADTVLSLWGYRTRKLGRRTGLQIYVYLHSQLLGVTDLLGAKAGLALPHII